MLKKWGLTVLLVLSLVLAGCGKQTAGENTCADGEKEHPDFRIGMVTDVGGVNDNSFNQSAWEGLQCFSEATGAEVNYLQSQNDSEYIPNLNQFVKEGWDITWGIGMLMTDAVAEVAKQNPDAKLALIDGVVEAPNVASVTFKENEGAFLVGVVAGLMTETGKIGFVGGMEIPVIQRFEAGFVAGVKEANPDAEVIINYTGAFNQPGQGKAAAATLYDQGVDIVFHAAGSTGDGVFNEAESRRENGENVWVIGVDRDQSITFGDEITLTSMMKRVDNAVQMVSERIANGEFEENESYRLGLKEDGVGLPEENPNVPDDVLQKVEEYKQQIIDGKISVPEMPQEG